MRRVPLSPRLPAVSRLAVGSLTVSGMQRNLPPEEAAAVLAYAFDRGVNFVDTAQYYENYGLIRRALALCRDPDSVVLSTKTYAWTKKLAEEAVEEARRETGRDVIDIFLLHEQESYDTLRGHREALEYLLDCRERGIVRAVGASTHHVALVKGLLRLADEGVTVDICHPLYNKAGIGIADGTERDMAEALAGLHARGVGIFAMKALGGGHLAGEAEDALRFVLEKDFIDAVAVGMQSKDEVDANIRFFEEGAFSDADRERLALVSRTLHVEEYCEGCGACVRRCAAGALRLAQVPVEEDRGGGELAEEFARELAAERASEPESPCETARPTEQEQPQKQERPEEPREAEQAEKPKRTRVMAEPDDEKCVRCGYCTKVCPVFALKIY